jgi:hypothetical protein
MNTGALMIPTMFSWRCKCGTRLKVVAEVDETQRTATAVATCPSCGDKQTIHAQRIISITTDKGENTPRLSDYRRAGSARKPNAELHDASP